MTIDLYYVPGSAPCRSVLLAARAVGVDLNLKLTNLMEGAHLTPEFLKVKYLVKLSVHIYMFISYDQCACNFSILGGHKNSFCAVSRALCLPRRKELKCDFVNGLRTWDLPQHLS